MRYSTSAYFLLSRTCRNATILLQISIGICVGFFIGFSLKYEYDTDIYSSINFDKSFVDHQRNNTSALINKNDINIRCVIIISQQQNRKSKYVATIRDTYSQQCDEVVYFTDSSELQKEFAGTTF